MIIYIDIHIYIYIYIHIYIYTYIIMGAAGDMMINQLNRNPGPRLEPQISS